MHPAMTKVALDAIDRKILKFLIKNARMPFQVRPSRLTERS